MTLNLQDSYQLQLYAFPVRHLASDNFSGFFSVSFLEIWTSDPGLMTEKVAQVVLEAEKIKKIGIAVVYVHNNTLRRPMSKNVWRTSFGVCVGRTTYVFRVLNVKELYVLPIHFHFIAVNVKIALRWTYDFSYKLQGYKSSCNL